MISSIISWPDGFDFPYFRKDLEKLQQQVDEVLICFTQHGNRTLKPWLRQNLPNCVLLDTDMYQANSYGGDWRNKSTRLMIDFSKGDWIQSLEQDFFIKDYAHFYSVVKKAMENYDVIMYEEGNRFHPACLFVKKDVLKKTRMEFSTNGQGVDHFAMVTDDLKGSAKYVSLKELGLIEGIDWFHMRGVTDNYFAPKAYYDLPTFHLYNDACRKLQIPFSDEWLIEMERCSKGERITMSSTIERFL